MLCRRRLLSRSTCKAVSLSTTTSPLTDATSSPTTFCRRTRSLKTLLETLRWLRFRFSCTASLPLECRSPAQWDFDRTRPSFTSRCVSASPRFSLNHCPCLLELSATSDTVNHSILFIRLSSWFGIRGSVLNWFKLYL